MDTSFPIQTPQFPLDAMQVSDHGQYALAKKLHRAVSIRPSRVRHGYGAFEILTDQGRGLVRSVSKLLVAGR